MFKWFLIHLGKSARRSSIWQKNIAINILVAFMALILLSYIALLGFFLDKILLEVVNDRDPENVLGGALLYYFIFGFVLRFFMQSIPAIQAIPYLHLPVKRNSLAHFLSLKSMTSLFNWLPFLLFLPFAVRWLSEFHSFESSLIWFLAILLFEWTVNFKLIWFKRKNTDKPWIAFLLLGVLLLLFLVDYWNVFSISAISEWYFMGILEHHYLILLPIIVLFLMYTINFAFIKNAIYLEDLSPKKKYNAASGDSFNKLKEFGMTGELILKEVRLLLRNKRSKTVLFLIPFFLLYGLFFYPQEIYMQKTGWLVFVGIFVTGGFLMAYGQYIMAWESSHFDFILSSNIRIYDYFKAKYYIMVIPTVILYFFSIPYIYFGIEVFWLNLAALFYNVGVNTSILLFTASYNKKRMDLSKGAMMNYQGVGINNFIVVMPLLIVPIIIYTPIKIFFGYEAGVIVLALLGVIGFSLQRYFINQAVKFFESKRYVIAQGYRNKH